MIHFLRNSAIQKHTVEFAGTFEKAGVALSVVAEDNVGESMLQSSHDFLETASENSNPLT